MPKKKLFIGAFAIIFTLAVGAQIFFNLVVWDTLQQQGTFQTRSLIVDALRGIENIKSSLNEDNKITDARIQLPTKQTNELGEILYLLQHDGAENIEAIQVSSSSMTETSLSLMSGANTEQLFEKVPQAQACSRGFLVYLETKSLDYHSPEMKMVGEKTLADERTIQVWRELGCGSDKEPDTSEYWLYENMNQLQDIILSAESY